MGVNIIGCGKAQPSLQIENDELAKIVETDDEWISSRTGISSRRVSVNETCLDLAAWASLEAMGQSSCKLSGDIDLIPDVEHIGWCPNPVDCTSIDLIILSTVSTDTIVPTTAALVKRALGCSDAIAFDINAACTGFIYALSVAESMMSASNNKAGMEAKPIKRALVVSSERLTKLADWNDRNTCVLFGDGAGAVLLEWDANKDGIVSAYLENTDDTDGALVCKNSYNSPQPFSTEGIICNESALEKHRADHPDPKMPDYSYINSLQASPDQASSRIDSFIGLANKNADAPEQAISMNGQRVFKFASKTMEKTVRKAASLAKLDPSDLNLIIPHQANLRIIEYAAKRLSLPLEMFQISISGTGNTSSAAVPMALTDALVANKVKPGDYVALVAFGGGLTSGAVILHF